MNDILSLSEADFGISFNTNSQLNLIASDIIFIKEDLSLILRTDYLTIFLQLWGNYLTVIFSLIKFDRDVNR